MGFGIILMRSMRFKSFFFEHMDLTPSAGPPPLGMLPAEAEPRLSSRKFPNCSRAMRNISFNPKEFSSDTGYLSRSFSNSIMYDGIIKDLTSSNFVCNSLENRETKKTCVWTRYPVTRRRIRIKTKNSLKCVDINGDSFSKISSHTCTRKLSKHFIEISLIGFRGERHNFSWRIRLDPSLRSWKWIQIVEI